MTFLPVTLGSRLQAEREKRGFTLEQVSASTKIPLALLEGLERDDLSRWPKGLYRRAFFRTYVTALGLPPEPLAGEFARLFPDDSSPEPPSAVFATASPQANSPHQPVAPASAGGAAAHGPWRSVLVAFVEVAAVVAAGSLVAWTAGISLLMGSGAVALVYYPVARAAGGRIHARWNVRRRSAAATAPLALISTAPAETGEVTSAVPRRSGPERVRARAATARTRLRHVHADFTSRWRPPAVRIANYTRQTLRGAATRSGHALGRSAEASGRVSSRLMSSTSIVLWRAGIVATRAFAHGARQTSRVSARGLAAANYAFWKAVRAAAEQAQLLAARQLNRTRE